MQPSCECGKCDDCLKRLLEAGCREESSCCSTSTDTSPATPSADGSKPDSSSGKQPSDTKAVAGKHPPLSSSATLSSGSMPEEIADDTFAESLPRDPTSQATDPSTSSSETGLGVVLEDQLECFSGTGTLSELTCSSLISPDDCFRPPHETAGSTKASVDLTRPDKSDDPHSQAPLSPMDFSSSEPRSPVDYSTDIAASVSLPPMDPSSSSHCTNSPCSSLKLTDPSVSEESPLPKSSSSSESRPSDRSIDSFSERSSISSTLPLTGSSAESYPKSTTRDSAGSADTLADISETAASSETLEPFSDDDGDNAGADAKKQSPTKKRRHHSLRQDKGPESPDDESDHDKSTAL